jgi:plasmid stabilization system protein ParE
MAIQTITIHILARTEFADSVRWYDTQQEGLGQQLEEAVRKKLNSLCENPHQGKMIRNGYREILIDRRFPFQIVFRLLNNDQALYISSIHHTSKSTRRKYRSSHWDDSDFVAEMERREEDYRTGQVKMHSIEEFQEAGRRAIEEASKGANE